MSEQSSKYQADFALANTSFFAIECLIKSDRLKRSANNALK